MIHPSSNVVHLNKVNYFFSTLFQVRVQLYGSKHFVNETIYNLTVS